jgi:AAA ATPase domain
MHIAFIEVKNFRKLLSVRIDLEPDKTLLVGANNSGKTSAIIALRSFLVRGGDIHIRDFTIANWSAIIAIGEKWAQPVDAGSPQAPTLAEWSPILPFVDVWIEAAAEELAYVRGMLPTLDWNGGLLGVRLRFEPEDDREFAQGYLVARRHVVEATKGNGARETSDLLWPKNLFAFLEKEIGSYFVIKAYLLDPAKVKPPTKGIAHPQELTANAMPLPSNPLAGLIRIQMRGPPHVPRPVAAMRGSCLYSSNATTQNTSIPSINQPPRISTHLRPLERHKRCSTRNYLNALRLRSMKSRTWVTQVLRIRY